MIPDQDEWYKALYYNPTALDNGAGGYTNVPSLTGGLNEVSGHVILNATEPADVTQAGSESWFGTFGQFSNAEEIVETAADGMNDDPSERALIFLPDWEDRTWNPPLGIEPIAASRTGGFRVASIPEPSTITLSLLPLLFALHGRRRRAQIQLELNQ